MSTTTLTRLSGLALMADFALALALVLALALAGGIMHPHVGSRLTKFLPSTSTLC